MHVFTDQVGSCNNALWGCFSNVGSTEQVGSTSQRNILPCSLGKEYRQIPGVPTSLCRSQWPHGLRRRSAAALQLILWVRIPPGTWMSISCECCVLSGRGLCDELITCPEESYRLWCVLPTVVRHCVWDLKTSWMRRPWPALGRSVPPPKKKKLPCTFLQFHQSQLCSWEAIVKTTTSFFDEGRLIFLLLNIGMIIPEC